MLQPITETLKASSVQIQRAVLAYALRSPLYADMLSAKADISCFSEDFSRKVFTAIDECVKGKITPSPHIVQQGIIARNPGPHYYTVFDLIKEVDFVAYDFEDILSLLIETRTRALVQKQALEIITQIGDVSRDFSQSMNTLREIAETPVGKVTGQTKTPKEILEEYSKEDGNVSQLLTGVPYWDEHYFKKGGSRRGQVEFILGHPKHGKTEYAIYRAVNYARQGSHIAWFQLEDTALSTTERIYSQCQDDFDAVEPFFHITDRVNYIEDILEECRMLKNKNMLDIVVIDYISNVRARGIKPGDTRIEVSTVSRKLTRAAIDLNCYMMNIAQLRRPDDSMKGWNVFPRYQDMRESSQLEGDAFVITGVFRPSQEPTLVVGEQVKWFDHKDHSPNFRPFNTVAVKCLAHRRQQLDHKVIEMQHLVTGLHLTHNEKPIWP